MKTEGKFTLELLNKRTEKDAKDGLKDIKVIYPKAKVKILKNLKSRVIYEVENG